MNKYALVFTGLIIFFASIANAERLSVKVSIANIRSGPGTHHEILWQVEKYHPLQILKKSGSWYRFRNFEKAKGWIHKSLLSKIPSVVTKRDCNIRSGPSTKNRIVFTAERGVAFRILTRKGNWIRVQHADGDKGWIYKGLVW